MVTSLTIINPKERNEKVRPVLCIKPLSNVQSTYTLPRVNTIHKSVEIKIQSEETGCRKSVIFISFCLINATNDLSSPILTPIISRWWCLCPSNQTTDRPNARRVPTSKQNSLPPKSSRIRHERSTTISLFSVSFYFPVVPPFDLSVHWFHSNFSTDTQIYTKFVLFLPNEILLSWNSWTKGVQVWQKMHYTITSWMERIRSRCVMFFSSCCQGI